MADRKLIDQLRDQGLEFHQAGRWDDAAAQYTEAIAADPAAADCHFLLALVETARGRLMQAHACIRAALALQPDDADFLFCLGDIERQRGEFEAAIQAFEAALDVAPAAPERMVQLSDLYLANGRPCAAEGWAREAVRLAPGDAEALHMLADTIRAQGRADDSMPFYRAAASGDDAYSVRHQNLLMTANYCDSFPAAAAFQAHRTVGQLPNLGPTAPALQVRTAPNLVPASEPMPLRVGYVSADFGHHVVSFFFEPVVAGHHRDKVQAYCYFTGGAEDAQCRRIRDTGVVWRNVSALDVDELVALMRSDRLHVAVDLSGHTAGNRLEAFARRVSPVQATWLGYPGTTGVPAIDYRFTDPVCDPIGESDTRHTETLWRLPGCFLVFQPRDDVPPPAPSPVARNGFITFGCFNRIEKLSTRALRLWADVLTAVPRSRLLLKARNLGEAALATSIRARFAASGGDPDRLDLEPPTATYQDHLARYAAVDIALDSHPYCGTTTTCESLWMGVPVLTLTGATHASRVGASLLTACGCAEYVCHTAREFTALAARLASSPKLLAQARADLRSKVASSALTDAALFVNDLEAAYAAMVAARP